MALLSTYEFHSGTTCLFQVRLASARHFCMSGPFLGANQIDVYFRPFPVSLLVSGLVKINGVTHADISVLVGNLRAAIRGPGSIARVERILRVRRAWSFGVSLLPDASYEYVVEQNESMNPLVCSVSITGKGQEQIRLYTTNIDNGVDIAVSAGLALKDWLAFENSL